MTESKQQGDGEEIPSTPINAVDPNILGVFDGEFKFTDEDNANLLMELEGLEANATKEEMTNIQLNVEITKEQHQEAKAKLVRTQKKLLNFQEKLENAQDDVERKMLENRLRQLAKLEKSQKKMVITTEESYKRALFALAA